MTTNAFIGGLTVKLGDAASPEVFTAIEEVIDFPDMGESNELVDATHFGSNGSKEYIAGLSDGDEITIRCNLLNTGNTQQVAMRTAVKAKATRNFEVVLTDGTNAETYAFAATLLSWKAGPTIDDRNTMDFTAKISGAITIT